MFPSFPAVLPPQSLDQEFISKERDISRYFAKEDYDRAARLFGEDEIQGRVEKFFQNNLTLSNPSRTANVSGLYSIISAELAQSLSNLLYIYAKLVLMRKLQCNVVGVDKPMMLLRAFSEDVSADVVGSQLSLYELGMLYYRGIVDGGAVKAQEYFEKYVEINGFGERFAISCYCLGAIFFGENKKSKAVEYFCKAIKDERCPEDTRKDCIRNFFRLSNCDVSLAEKALCLRQIIIFDNSEDEADRKEAQGRLEDLGKTSEDTGVLYHLAITQYYEKGVLHLGSLSLEDFADRLKKDELLLKYRNRTLCDDSTKIFKRFHQRYMGILVELLKSHLRLFKDGKGLSQELLTHFIEETYLFVTTTRDRGIKSFTEGVFDRTSQGERLRFKEQLDNYAKCLELMLTMSVTCPDILAEEKRKELRGIIDGDGSATLAGSPATLCKIPQRMMRGTLYE